MPDREKVIKAIEICIKNGCKDGIPNQLCPYSSEVGCDLNRILADALALLKEQQQQIWELQDQVEYLEDKRKEQETANLYKCPNCGTWVSAENVVRCKDCKHGGCRTQHMDGSIFRVVCKKYSTKRNERWMDADWFCADGERKET